MDTKTAALTTMLQCGSADLDMLDRLYSELGEECADEETILEENHTLNGIIYALYSTVQFDMVTYLKNFVNSTADSEEDTIDDYIETEYCEETKEERKRIHDLITRAVDENITKLENSYPYANCLDSSFNSDLDQVVDWEYSLHDNAINLIEYWVRNLED